MKIILKGILLWLTIIYTMLLLAGVDSIANMGIAELIITIISDVVLVIICKKVLTKEEFEILTLQKWFNNKFGDL